MLKMKLTSDSLSTMITKLLFTVAMIYLARGGSASLPDIHWTDAEFLDPDQRVHLSWLTDKDNITLEVTALTLGWVGIGMSVHGGMRGADIIVGWVTDGVPTVQNRFAVDYIEPILDDHQNVDLLGGYENDTHTVLRFRRWLRTCDQHSVEITDNTMRVLYATNPHDPEDGHLLKHDYRGVSSVVFINAEKFNDQWENDDVLRWEVRQPGIAVPMNTDTLYWGTPFKMIDLPKKHHLIAWEPLISKESHPFVHHMIFMSCNPDNETLFEEHIGRGFKLYTRQTPDILASCSTLLLAFGFGGKGQDFDSEIGYPFGDGATNSKYFVLETHYDNRNFLNAPKEDRSGIRVILTPKLRKNDGWSLQVGHEIAHQIIPPGQSRFTSVGYCSSECSGQHLREGIKLLSAIPHTHLTGRTIKLRHFRDGVELPPILDDEYYDFSLQVFRTLKNQPIVLPGDSLMVECGYNTSLKQNVTWGGLPTSSEMCVIVLTYYPKQDIALCMSTPSVEDLGQFFGFKFSGEVRPLSEPAEYASIVNNFDFKPRIKEFQQLVKSRYMDMCVVASRAEIQDQTSHKYPEINNAYNVTVERCNETATSS